MHVRTCVRMYVHGPYTTAAVVQRAESAPSCPSLRRFAARVPQRFCRCFASAPFAMAPKVMRRPAAAVRRRPAASSAAAASASPGNPAASNAAAASASWRRPAASLGLDAEMRAELAREVAMAGARADRPDRGLDPPAFRERTKDVIYISPHWKVNPTFLVASSGPWRVQSYLLEDDALLEQFQPAAEGLTHYRLLRVTVRFPLNRAARRQLADFDTTGELVNMVAQVGLVPRSVVLQRCASADYPLF